MLLFNQFGLEKQAKNTKNRRLSHPESLCGGFFKQTQRSVNFSFDFVGAELNTNPLQTRNENVNSGVKTGMKIARQGRFIRLQSPDAGGVKSRDQLHAVIQTPGP